MDKDGNRERGGRGVKHYYDLYAGGKRLGDTSEIFVDSVRFSHFYRHGFKVSDWYNGEK